jgi:hypothetical protein
MKPRRPFPLLWLLIFFIIAQALQADKFSYSYIPKKIYSTQIFPITLLAKDVDTNDSPTFSFDPESHAKPIEPLPVKVANGNDVFYTFYFQAEGSDDFKLPQLTIRNKLVTNTLLGQMIHTDELNTTEHKDFCGLIATDCTLLSSQLSMFDNNHTLVSIIFKAHEANPNAIKIPSASEEGLEKVERKNTLVNVEYYFVIPSSQKNTYLSYYNTVEHRFISSTIKTDYRNKPVAAQVELNPKASPFDKLKKYGSIALALFFALMYWWKRDLLYLILLISVVFLIYIVYRPKATLCIQEGAPLYILPTHNSRVSTTVNQELNADSLGMHDNYYKINYHNGIIGWINHENLCQD